MRDGTKRKAVVAFFICSFIQKGISVLTTPIFTRLLTTSEYGQFSLFFSYYNILYTISTLCITSTLFVNEVIKYKDEEEQYANSLIALGTISHLTILMLVILFRNYIPGSTGLDKWMFVPMIISAWANMIFKIWSVLQRISYKYVALVLVTFLSSLLKPFLGVISIIILPNYHIEARIVTMVFVEVIFYSSLMISILLKSKCTVRFAYWKDAVRLYMPLIPHYLTKTALNQSDKIMINHYVGLTGTGIYNLAHSLSFLMTVFNEGLLYSYSPWFFREVRNNSSEEIWVTSRNLIILSALANGMVVTLSPEAIKLFAPSEYYDSVSIIPPLTTCVLCMLIYSIFSNYEFYYEKPKYVSVASVTGGIINIVLNIIFIQRFGYKAAAYTTLICYILYVIFHYCFMKKSIEDARQKVDNRYAKFSFFVIVFYIIVSHSILLLVDFVVLRLVILAAVIVLTVCLFKNKYHNMIGN